MGLRSLRRLVAGSWLALALVACGDGAGAGDRSIRVLAAASLTDAFEQVAVAFEAAHPGLAVELSFAASSSLRAQILDGLPADVFASADAADMDAVVDAGAAVHAALLARNHLQIVVPAGNPGGVSGLEDFGDGGLLLGLCAEEVPCGRLARLALDEAGVSAAVDTHEPDVRSLLTKVEAGELDAGIVYATDVLAAGDAVEGIEIPPEHDVAAPYLIAVLAASEDADLAEAFVAFALAEEAGAILAAHGFDEP